MGSVIRLERATGAHAMVLAAHMREADVLELRAADGLEPLAAVFRSMDVSRYSYALYLGDELAAIWGVREQSLVGGPRACPWMLTSDAVDRHPVTFWRFCKMVIEYLSSQYEELFNEVDDRHTRALAWIARLGFEVDAARPFGKAGLPFHHVTLRRAHV